MTLEMCYAAMGGDYANVLSRLPSEKLVQKYVLRFLEDDTCQTLRRTLESGDLPEAFRAAHSLKGICQSLSFTQLEPAVCALTEALRAGDLNAARSLAPRFLAAYDETIDVLQAYRASL